MRLKLIIFFMIIITVNLRASRIDTLWQHTLPPFSISSLELSRDLEYIYFKTNYNFLIEKVNDKYIHYKLPDMATFYTFTIDDKIIGYDKKDSISVYDCKEKTMTIYDVSFLKDYTYWEMAYITSKTYAIVNPYNDGEAKVFELGTNKILSEFGWSNLLPVKKIFLSYDETYFIGILDGPQVVKYDLNQQKVLFKKYLPDWQEPKYNALFVNDTVIVIYDDDFKDFLTIDTKDGKIMLEDTCDYYYRFSNYDYIYGNNNQILFNYIHIPDDGPLYPIIVNWKTGEKVDFKYRDFFALIMNQNDTILLRKDTAKTGRCIVFFDNVTKQTQDTIYDVLVTDTLFSNGYPNIIFGKHNIMCNTSGNPYIYSLDKAEKVEQLMLSDAYSNGQYSDDCLSYISSFSPEKQYNIYNIKTKQVEKELTVHTSSVLDFYQNKRHIIQYNPISIYDFIDDTVIYKSNTWLFDCINGAFFGYDVTDLGNYLYRQKLTYIPVTDTNQKQIFEYDFSAPSYYKALAMYPQADVSVDRKKLAYYNYNNHIIKVDLENDVIDSIIIDIVPMKVFFSKDGQYIQIRDTNNLRIYDYSTNELLISYSKTKKERIISNDYIDYLILYNDTFRTMMCVKFNLDFLDVKQEYRSENITEFQIYPNPANSILNIQAKHENPIISIEIYNLYGEQLNKIAYINSQNYSLDLSTYPIGAYYLKINGYTSMFVKKE